MFIIVLKKLTPKWVRAITLFPFIILSDEKDKENVFLLHHEKIHIRQQAALLIIPFYVWYLIEFLIRLLQYKNWNVAYRNISFEREAYQNEKNLHYLQQRSFFGFMFYL